MSTPPTPRTLAVQIGRHWAEHTTVEGGLLFVEHDSSEPGNLYAAPLPRLAHRLPTAASITPRPTPATEPNRPLRAITLVVEAHAPTMDGALALLEDLARLLWPTDGPFHVPPEGVDDPGGLIGGEPGGPLGVTEPIWRIVTMEMDSTPAPIVGGGEGTATDDGQQAASMSLTAECVVHETE